MRNSVWQEKVKFPKFNKLTQDKNTDVLVIGGGLCGILCAYFLKEAGLDYILVEGDKIASHTTKNTTAKITSQHGLIYQKLISDFGKEKAQMYLAANQDALKEYEKLCKIIDCDFEYKPAYTYSLSNSAIIEKEVEAVNSLGFGAEFKDTTELPFKTRAAICFPAQAQFNPIKFISGLAKDLNIYEDTFIHNLSSNICEYNGGKIRAKKIIVATHFPFINRHGSYFLKLYQHRSYVSAYENAQNLEGMYVDESMNGMSFRNYGNKGFCGVTNAVLANTKLRFIISAKK